MQEVAEKINKDVKPRLGFLGVGWIGKSRMDAVHRSGLSEITALCDFSADTAAQASREVGNCAITASYEELLQQDVDGVLIATPSALHAAQTQAALEKSKAVFVQKPLALDAKTTTELVNLAEKNDCLLHVDFSYRHTKAMQALREVITSGEIGEVYAANLVFHNAYGPDKSWYYNVKEAGGGCLTDLGIHLVDLLFWMFPDAEVTEHFRRLYKGGRQLTSGQRDVEDFAEASLALSNGSTARIACSWNLPAGREAVIEATFYGSKGGVKFENINGSFYDFKTSLLKGTQSQLLAEPPDDWSGRAAVYWAGKLRGGNHFDPACRQYIKVAQTLDMIYTT